MVECDGCDGSVSRWITCRNCTDHYCYECFEEYLDKIDGEWMHKDKEVCRECIHEEMRRLENLMTHCRSLLRKLDE